ncbi:MAG: 1-(5-phosphoribosyl)-5-((5-phosphoribosylamino)methylideneamino)imidazole-4-carboxamide isomerase [Proteobacteria bacterium]|nr:1-(5-phosphoribosyl)-5-((5-phosphoribosylamino)methylideneamino)imidazole-4-carboxamide isomerase [Pseudomonadota bacterium]
MLLIPAIALKEGRAVGTDGKPYRETPEDFAARLVDAGISRLQLVDEDSLVSERGTALALIERIARRVDTAFVQVVTGVKDEDEVQSHLDAGAHWLVLGHRAASAPHVLKDLCLEFPGHILIGMNVRDGHMTGDAHSKLSNHDLVDLAEHFQSDGVSGIVYQDVDTDGASTNLSESGVREIADAVSVDVFVASRIESMAALEAACSLADADIAGAIVNGALHDIDFAVARRLVEERD